MRAYSTCSLVGNIVNDNTCVIFLRTKETILRRLEGSPQLLA